jgi:hypothetical protein
LSQHSPSAALHVGGPDGGNGGGEELLLDDDDELPIPELDELLLEEES